MRAITFLIAGLLFSNTNFSQVYSLEDCFAAAKENNISLKKSKNNIESNYIDRKAATFNLLPSVYANAQHIFYSGKNIDPVTNNFVKDNFSGGEFDVTFQLNIFSGFNALNAIKNSLYKMKAGEYDYQKSELQTFSAVTLAYAKVIYAKEQAATIKNNNFYTQHQLDIIQQKIEAGKLSKSDFYTVNTLNKREQAALISAQNDSGTAINELKYLTGMNYNQPFEIKNIDSTEIENIAHINFTLSEIIDKVLKNHPALLASKYSEKSKEMNLKSARGNLLPNVSLTGNLFSNYNLMDRNLNGSHIELSRQINNNFGKTAGILVGIPLFNRYQNRFAIEREKINLANAKLETQQVENDIVKNTQQLLNDFISAKQEYLLQTEALQQGGLAYEAFEERHKLGYISSLELIFAKEELYKQQAQTIESKYALYFKYKLLELLINVVSAGR